VLRRPLTMMGQVRKCYFRVFFMEGMGYSVLLRGSFGIP